MNQDCRNRQGRESFLAVPGRLRDIAHASTPPPGMCHKALSTRASRWWARLMPSCHVPSCPPFMYFVSLRVSFHLMSLSVSVCASMPLRVFFDLMSLSLNSLSKLTATYYTSERASNVERE